MGGFFDRFMGGKRDRNSANRAKKRLEFILVHDRINLPPERLKAMKEEILAVISKYVTINSEQVDIALQSRDRSSMIVAEIPFSGSVFPETDSSDLDDTLPRADWRPDQNSPDASS